MGAGAGILFVARSTGRVLLALRSRDSSFPGTWCVVGGNIERGETPAQAAVREAQEEVGYSGAVELYKGLVFRTQGFAYHNFVGVVPVQFKPVLNDESMEATWFDAHRLPEPLHPGAEKFFDSIEPILRRSRRQR
jgi:8-oxo-dGTP pyrophosphatase MutT (NUDIX family)